jgi:predicted DNA-binding protein
VAKQTDNGERQAVLVRLPHSTHRRLQELAKREHRTMTAEANVAIEAHLAKVEAEGAKS